MYSDVTNASQYKDFDKYTISSIHSFGCIAFSLFKYLHSHISTVKPIFYLGPWCLTLLCNMIYDTIFVILLISDQLNLILFAHLEEKLERESNQHPQSPPLPIAPFRRLAASSPAVAHIESQCSCYVNKASRPHANRSHKKKMYIYREQLFMHVSGFYNNISPHSP